MSRRGRIESVDDESLALDPPVSDFAEPEAQEAKNARPRWWELDNHVREAEPIERFFEQNVEDLMAVSPERGGQNEW